MTFFSAHHNVSDLGIKAGSDYEDVGQPKAVTQKLCFNYAYDDSSEDYDYGMDCDWNCRFEV